MWGSAELTAESQHELQVLLYVRDQLFQLRYSAEIKAISDALEDKEINQVKLNLLRTQILQIYRNEQAERYHKSFYDALFSLLLLLAKYAPYDVEPLNQNGIRPPLICAVSMDPIEEKFRVLTISGYQFDGSNPPVFEYLARQGIPQNRAILGQREKDYLVSRKNAINTPDNQMPEIPHPNPPQPMSRQEGAFGGLRIGYFIGVVAFGLLAFPGLLVAGLITLGGLTLCGTIIGAFAPEKVRKLLNYFHLSATRKLFSRIQTLNESKPVPDVRPVAELKQAVPEVKNQQEVQTPSKLLEIKTTAPLVDAQQPLLPRSPIAEQPRRLSRGLERLLMPVENKNKLAVKKQKEKEKEKSAKTYGATDIGSKKDKNGLLVYDTQQDLLSESLSPAQQQFELQQERKRIRHSFLDRVTAEAKRSAEASQEIVQKGKRLA